MNSRFISDYKYKYVVREVISVKYFTSSKDTLFNSLKYLEVPPFMLRHI
jgi:hypothetical protein